MRDRYASLREGLVGAWIPSVSGSGLLLPDLSGQGNNGTLTNMDASDWVSGQYGKALDFDGSNDYVISSIPPLTNTLTIALWFYLRNGSVNQALVQVDEGRGFERHLLAANMGIANTPLRAFSQTNGQGGAQSDFNGLQTGRWYHAVGVFRGGSFRQAYLNGVPATADTTSVATGTVNSATIAVRRYDFTPALYLDGNVDDIRIYNRALSEPEIKLLASRPGIGLRPQRRTIYYAPPTGARRRRILTSMP